MSPIEETLVISVDVPEIQQLDFNSKEDIATIKSSPVIVAKSGKFIATKVKVCTKSVLKLTALGYANNVVINVKEGAVPAYLYKNAVVLVGDDVKDFYIETVESEA
jgi:hypothetical protein